MSQKVEIPETDLREMVTDYHTLVEKVRDMGVDWDSTLAWELFDSYLPRKPVTKDTAWGTPIVSEAGTTATFIGPHPTNQRRFIGLCEGTPLPLRYDWWFEAEPEPEPERIPVEVQPHIPTAGAVGGGLISEVRAEKDELRAVIASAAEELAGSHRQYDDLPECVTCSPQDDTWPCVARVVADGLQAAAMKADDAEVVE